MFEQFPNGETKLIESSVDFVSVLMNDVHLKYESDLDLIKLMFVKKYIESKGGESILTIYYMPYSRMDRSENGSAFTLQYVADFIKNLNFYHIQVVEPHSDVTPALLGNRVDVVHMSEKILELAKLEVGFDEEKDYIMFPDLGASRRYKNIGTNNVLIGHKVRDFKTGDIVKLDLIGKRDKGSKKVVIVDDLSSRGGTFVHSAHKLREEGFQEVYLVVSHSENTIFKGELFDNVNKVFTTDSILTEQSNLCNRRFEPQLKVYNIKELLSNE